MGMASKVCLPRGFKYKLSYNKYRQTMSLQIELNVWGQCWTRTDRCPCAASPPWGGRCWRAAVHGDQLDQLDHGHHSCLWSRSWSTPASSSPQCSPSLNFYQWATCSYGERRGCGPSACWKILASFLVFQWAILLTWVLWLADMGTYIFVFLYKSDMDDFWFVFFSHCVWFQISYQGLSQAKNYEAWTTWQETFFGSILSFWIVSQLEMGATSVQTCMPIYLINHILIYARL